MKSVRLLLLLSALLLLSGCAPEEIDAPKEITAVWGEDHAIHISFSESENAEIYRLFRRDQEMQDFRFIADLTKPTFVDQTARAGVPYQYKVIALNQKGNSQGAVTEYFCSLPLAPQSPAIAIHENGVVSITWEEDTAQLYHLYGIKDGEYTHIAQTAENSITLDQIQSFDAFVLSGIHTQYGITLESDYSQPLSILPTPVIQAISRLDKYTSVIEINDNAQYDRYQVYRANTRRGQYSLIGESSDPVYYDVSETADAEYYYKIQAISARGVSGFSMPWRTGLHQKEVIGIPVFMYHDFVTQLDLDSGVLFDEYAIWKDEFEQDLIWLKDNGYTTITSQELIDYLNGNASLPEKPIILTIDGGKMGVYKNAYPLLKEHNMKAVLAVSGNSVEVTTADPVKHLSSSAPYCRWDEIIEMASSGCVEVISQTYALQIKNPLSGRNGANLIAGETMEDFLILAKEDYYDIQNALIRATGKTALAQSYPYSLRSAESDIAWLKCGYQLLYCGDDSQIRSSQLNYFIQDAGLTPYSALIRRLPRRTGTPLSEYLLAAIDHDS